MHAKFQFMRGVLGEEGALALSKAAGRSSALENVLLPRTIVAWLELASRMDSFEGALPGIDNTYLQFQKSDEQYSGSIGIEGDVYSFNNASVYHVAASVAVALGLDREPVDSRIRPADLARLGKTIDILSKSHALVDNLKKAEGPGPAAAPLQPGKPQEAVAPKMQPRIPTVPKKVTIPGMPKLPSVKVTKAESEMVCRDCGRKQFIADRFTGCFCFMSLSKSVKSTPTVDGFNLEFRGEWDRESVAILLKSMGK